MRIACVQANVSFGQWEINGARAVEELERLSQLQVDLAVFPEAFLTGYCVSSREEALRIAIGGQSAIPDLGHEQLDYFVRYGDLVQELQEACDRCDIAAIVGFAEYDSSRNLYNSAVLLEPGELPRVYRKVHLPELGLDRFVTPGDELPVFDTRLGKIGILICYDQRVPEAARVLALKGADLIVLPTNWPEGAETSADHVCITRAAENHVFYAACNRVGTENGFTFIGRSKIIGPTGRVLAAAGADEETIMADIDLPQARSKRIVVIPGQYELPVFGVRRPELYGVITEPSQ